MTRQTSCRPARFCNYSKNGRTIDEWLAAGLHAGPRLPYVGCYIDRGAARMNANEADTPGANATPVTPAQEAARRWLDGAELAPSMSLREMGKVASVGKDTVARSRGGRAAIVRGADEKTYLSAEARIVRASVVLGLGAEGWSIRRIAEATGINRETVRRDLRDYRRMP